MYSHVSSSIPAVFSFPVVPHKPVLLHQKCPDGYTVPEGNLLCTPFLCSDWLLVKHE